MHPSSLLGEPGRRAALLNEALGSAQDHGAELPLLDDEVTLLVEVKVLSLDPLVLRYFAGQEPLLRFPLRLCPAHNWMLASDTRWAR